MTQVLEKSNKTLAIISVKKLQKASDHAHILTTDVEREKKSKNVNGISRKAAMYGHSTETGYFHGLPFNTPFGSDAMKPT